MPVPTETPASPRSAVRLVAGDIAAQVAKIERTRGLPADLVGRLRSAGLFSLALPRVLGGRECAPQEIVDVVEELSRVDASVGWTVLIGQGSGFLAWLDPAVAKEIAAQTPEPVVASSMAPTGTGREVLLDDGRPGYRLSGRWPMTSGSEHCDWLMCTFEVAGGDGKPVLGPGRRPVRRMAFVPAVDVRVLDTWTATGLRGTGSHDVEVDAVDVPHERTIDPFGSPPRVPGPLYSTSFFAFLMVCMAGFPLGVAQRALDELVDTARSKRRAGGGELMAADPVVQAAVFRSGTALRAARALVAASVAELTGAVAEAGSAPPPVRARLAGAVVHAMTTAKAVVDDAFHRCGASALYLDKPLQRCFRDVHTAAQHVAFGPAAVERLGRVELGLPVPEFLL
jgi:alkylation response protein AidB-like acyl-CoA dehydrogenase